METQPPKPDRDQITVLARYAGLDLDSQAVDALVPLLEDLIERVRKTEGIARSDVVPASVRFDDA
jgi:hypothetical protein